MSDAPKTSATEPVTTAPLTASEEERRVELISHDRRTAPETEELAALQARLVAQPAVVAVPLTDAETARLAVLQAKKPDPNAPSLDTRTPEEQAEFAKLSEAKRLADEAAAAPKPVVILAPRDRLKALQAKSAHPMFAAAAENVRTESEEIAMRRLEEQIAEEDRLAELRALKVRTPEQSVELGTLEAREALR